MARKPSRNEWRQSKKGLWVRSLGDRGVRIRLFQKRRGGNFFRSVWTKDRGENRKCLGTSDRSEAERLGKDLLSALLKNEYVEASGTVTLSNLWERYKAECISFLDNDPRTIAEAESHAAILLSFFGKDCDVRQLTEQDQLAFTKKRLAGGLVGLKNRKTEPVRSRSVEVDLKLLHSMLRWATTVRVSGGKRFLDSNPLAGIKRLREQNPKRPMATWERFEATRESCHSLAHESKTDADRRKWIRLEMALVLAEATGRRVGSIRKLAWADIDTTNNTIRWRAENDKKRKEWVIPAPPALVAELKAFRVRLGGAFGGLVFPSESDSSAPIRRDVLGQWLIAAEKKAKLSKLEGGAWHPYRRAWATSRKHLPTVDVAQAGGWSDLNTLMKCYQQADSDTLLAVMLEPRKVFDRVKAG